MSYQPFVITYTITHEKDKPGGGEKVRGFSAYGDALARFRQLKSLPQHYENVEANFETDTDVIANFEASNNIYPNE